MRFFIDIRSVIRLGLRLWLWAFYAFCLAALGYLLFHFFADTPVESLVLVGLAVVWLFLPSRRGRRR